MVCQCSGKCKMADERQSKSKKKTIKYFLSSPYKLNWPELDKGDNKLILDAIKSIFPINGLKREKSLISQEDSKFVTWQSIKSCMAIGVNSVTKSLEKDELVLVLVCKSTKPALLTKHLMLLSATRSTSCCAIFGLSDIMASFCGMKTVAACGFKKNLEVNMIKDLTDFITCKIPPYPEHYLTLWNNNGHYDFNKTCEEEESKDCQNKKSNENLKKQMKRKIDATYVKTKIKGLSPRETPKMKKIKISKTYVVK
ncbi:ribonuclease P protein subunit p38-like [Xenia sp. Carnegie-2017]|uniref:ribonuclease P protein subunit p38-like n=1 Tax=Xenia sp. Carnegie-2017 TaxID=2897299 RepID=UPI001F046CE6|nr:ribonuclease P protein subunit p38-like [Xenia sp. Carnegie-2017]